MAKFELLMPKMGESVDEATIINWLKNVGDKINEDDLIVEIATDKVDSEVPSEVSGILLEKLCKINDVIQVGEPIAIIETKGDDSLGLDKKPKESKIIQEPIEVFQTDDLTEKVKNIIDFDKKMVPSLANFVCLAQLKAEDSQPTLLKQTLNACNIKEQMQK